MRPAAPHPDAAAPSTEGRPLARRSCQDGRDAGRRRGPSRGRCAGPRAPRPKAREVRRARLHDPQGPPPAAHRRKRGAAAGRGPHPRSLPIARDPAFSRHRQKGRHAAPRGRRSAAVPWEGRRACRLARPLGHIRHPERRRARRPAKKCAKKSRRSCIDHERYRLFKQLLREVAGPGPGVAHYLEHPLHAVRLVDLGHPVRAP